MTITDACLEATQSLGPWTPREINDGLCFNWAAIVFDLVEGAKIAGHNAKGRGHSWIEYDGLCYDAECPEGVRCCWYLPFWERVL